MCAEIPLSSMDEVAGMFDVDDYMAFYSGFLTPARSDAETAQLAGLLDMHPRNGALRILDLACGFGRIANRLALLGHRVTGVEYQAGFLSLARAEARRNNLLAPQPGGPNGSGGSVRYVRGDMRELDYTAEFERALLLFNSFGYFTDAENLAVLRRVAQALTPGGLLGFDIANRDALLAGFQPETVMEVEGALMVNRFSFDALSGRLHNHRSILRSATSGGADIPRREIHFSIRLYSATEIRDLLERAGLRLQTAYAEWDATPLRADSPAMALVAQKPD